MSLQTIERMASEMACKIVYEELSIKQDQRRLFKYIETTTIAEYLSAPYSSNTSLDQSIRNQLIVDPLLIKKQIHYLFETLLQVSIEFESNDINELSTLGELWRNRVVEKNGNFLHSNSEKQEFCPINNERIDHQAANNDNPNDFRECDII